MLTAWLVPSLRLLETTAFLNWLYFGMLMWWLGFSCLHMWDTHSIHLLLQVEVKPYVLDDQMCDECQGTRCGGKFAPFFCANVTCLQYYCEYCWASIHSRAGREFHKPLVKEGGDRPRHVPFRWSWSLDLNPAASTGADDIEGRRECCLRALVFWKSVHSSLTLMKRWVFLITIITIIYSHITELCVQYNTSLAECNCTDFALWFTQTSAWYLNFLHKTCHVWR